MADVFLSYAREDRASAQALAEALALEGWSVWWDHRIIVGEAFDQAIERELHAAKSVVVLWSDHSVASEWVKNEAAAAAERGVLVPVLITNIRPPLEFRRRQTADLTDWAGDAAHPGFQALCEGVGAAINGGVPPRRRGALPAGRGRGGRRWRWALVALAILALAIGTGLWSMHRAAVPPPSVATPQSERPTADAERPNAAAPSVTGTASATTSLADLVVGTYVGAVIADSRGGSRNDVTLTIRKIDARTVRVTADYTRLGTVDVDLDRIDNLILSTGGDTTLRLDLDSTPPTIDYNPHGEVAFSGRKH